MITKSYDANDFMAALQATEGEGPVIAEESARCELSYRRLTLDERDKTILGILQKLESFSKVGAYRDAIWDGHWTKARQKFHDSGRDLKSLDPSFVDSHPVLRLHGDYALALSARFETLWFRVMRHWLFARYLPGALRVLEFGCGSGFNLAALARMNPGIELIGLDWSPSAVALVDDIARAYAFNLKGRQFDFFNPDPTLPIDGNTVVMSFAALEQVGAGATAFADWLLARRPKLVLNVEPILEYYNPDILFDYLAVLYHQKREYLTGYLGWARTQAEAGRIEILSSFRPGFGSLYHEGYSVLVWRPV